MIPADRVETNVELSRILADLFPLLRAVRPADLNATLNALATALGGRGEQLGQTMDELDAYLGEIGDHLPTLREDLVKLADVADTYDLAAPDLLGALAQRDRHRPDGRRQREAARRLLLRPPGPRRHLDRGAPARTRANLIRVGQVTEPVLKLLAVYSPELPCLLQGAARYAPRLARDLRGQPGQAVHRVRHRRSTARTTSATSRRTARSATGRGASACRTRRCPAPPVALDQGSDMDENPPTSPLPGLPRR